MIYKSTTLRNFSCFTILTAKSEKTNIFCNNIIHNFLDKRSHLELKKNHLKSVHWSKYNTWSPKNDYILDTFK